MEATRPTSSERGFAAGWASSGGFSDEAQAASARMTMVGRNRGTSRMQPMCLIVPQYQRENRDSFKDSHFVGLNQPMQVLIGSKQQLTSGSDSLHDSIERAASGHE